MMDFTVIEPVEIWALVFIEQFGFGCKNFAGQ
jgi:hypothetical protein